MTFESRQAARRRTLDRVIIAFKMLGLVYMALHLAVTVLAYDLARAGTAVLTFVSLGIGDLYWAVTWMREEGRLAIAAVASVATALCFISWGTRSAFDRWANAFTADMLSDARVELKETFKRLERDEEPGEGTRT